MTLLWFVAGLVLLLFGAEMLVRGASRLAAAFAVPPLVIGLTVVAFGTSAPELAVSIGAALDGRADIALGNVMGSNIFNILLILGLSALIYPLAVSITLIRIEVPIMIGASSLVVVLAWNNAIGRWEGALLVVLGLAYLAFQAIQGSADVPRPETSAAQPPRDAAVFWRSSLAIVIGLGLLVLGSRWLVDGAVSLARSFGISELLIGLTIIATGTSLPEVATSIMASLRKERDLAVGNVIGSNIFNLLWVLGLSSLLSKDGIQVSPQVLASDLPIMLATAIACLPIFFTGQVIERWEGGLFLAYYLGYTVLLILQATHSEILPMFQIAFFGFVLPLTLLTLGLLLMRSLRQ